MIATSDLLIATLGGAAVGLEREWSGHARGPAAGFGGIRTFTMLGAIGGLSGSLLLTGWTAVAAILAAGGVTIVALGYAAKSRRNIDATTEVAAIVVLAAGVIAGMGQATVASGIVSATVLLLLEKSRLHGWVERLDSETLRASVRFAVLALIVLPLLPRGPYGPFDAIRPHELWILVLFFSGLSFLAWLARRALGTSTGTIVTGLLGGVISSTSVTLSFAQESRRSPTHGTALALGSIGACTVMLVRVAATSAVLNWPIAKAFAVYAVPGLVIGLLVLSTQLLRRRHDSAPASDDSPLRLRAALQMTVLFQIVLIAISAVVAWWSVTALLLTSAMVGLTDLDALTVSLARTQPALPAPTAARALAVGVLANTVLKLGVAVVIGEGPYRRLVAVVLGLMAITTGLVLWFLR